MERARTSLQPEVETFLQQVVLIDELRRQLEELDRFEAVAVPSLQSMIDKNRAAVREARATLREVRSERRRQERRLLKLRRASGLEPAAPPRPARWPKARVRPDPILSAGREVIQRLAQCRERLTVQSARTRIGLRASQSAAERSYGLLQETRAASLLQ